MRNAGLHLPCPARFAMLSLALASAGSPAFGSDLPGNGTLSLIVENDLFYDTDRNYTSGVAVTWVPGRQSAPEWPLRLARQLPWVPEGGEIRQGYAIGQNMYTPRDTSLANPPRDDRPYAGWLYGTVGLGIETGRQLDQLAITLGMVGPASLARQSQKFVHRVRHFSIPQGWDTQLHNEPGIIMSYQRSWRALAASPLAGLSLGLTPHLGGALGNVYTYANAGMTLRFGRGLSLDYGPLRIQPSMPGSGFVIPSDKFAWYLFVGLEGRAVARNIFLDGNTFRDSRSVDKKPLVGDLQWGVSVMWRGARLSYTHVLRSREFKTQKGRDQFGAFTLTVPF